MAALFYGSFIQMRSWLMGKGRPLHLRIDLDLRLISYIILARDKQMDQISLTMQKEPVRVLISKSQP